MRGGGGGGSQNICGERAGSIRTTKSLYCVTEETTQGDQVTQLRSWTGSGRPADQGLAPSPMCPWYPYIPSTFCPPHPAVNNSTSQVDKGSPPPPALLLSILHVSVYPPDILVRRVE